MGGFFRGVYRTALPYLKRGGNTIGGEALHASKNIINDVASKGLPIRAAVRNRLRESGRNLKRKANEKLDKILGPPDYNIADEMQPRQLSDNPERENISIRKKRAAKRNPQRTRKKQKKNSRTARDIFEK